MLWTAASLKSSASANLAVVNLRRQNYTVLLPVVLTQKTVRNKLCKVPEPLFPNYVLIGLDEGQRWAPIRYTYGIGKLLLRRAPDSDYDEPQPLPAGFVDSLETCCCRDERTDTWVLQAGTRVKILSGSLAGYDAVVTSMSGSERVRLLVEIMNRQVPVTLWLSAVAAV